MRHLHGYSAAIITFLVTLIAGCSHTVPDQKTVEKTAEKTAERESDATITEPAVTLHVGDPAPPLKLAHWVKGDSLEGFDRAHVYVVEFWATWCGPCKVSMPHLSELQQKFSDSVTFVGISDEDQETVDNFFASTRPDGKTWDEVVTYHIALDTDDDDTGNAYMRAAGQSGIPTAFVVGQDGHIEWIGHPAGIEQPLEQIVAGKWDRNLFASRLAKQQQQQAVVRRAFSLVRSKKYEEGLELFKKLVDDNWDDPAFLNAAAWTAVADIPAASSDLAWAQKVSLHAAELTHHKDPSVLDTVARVYYEQHQLDAAIEWQQKAADLTEDQSIRETLKSYLAERDGDTADSDRAAKTAESANVDDQASSH